MMNTGTALALVATLAAAKASAPGGKGVPDVGNTSYIGAAMQVLASFRDLVPSILAAKDKGTRGSGEEVALNYDQRILLRQLQAVLWAIRYGTEIPAEFMENFAQRLGRFLGIPDVHKLQDVGEFWLKLLALLEEQLMIKADTLEWSKFAGVMTTAVMDGPKRSVIALGTVIRPDEHVKDLGSALKALHPDGNPELDSRFVCMPAVLNVVLDRRDLKPGDKFAFPERLDLTEHLLADNEWWPGTLVSHNCKYLHPNTGWMAKHYTLRAITIRNGDAYSTVFTGRGRHILASSNAVTAIDNFKLESYFEDVTTLHYARSDFGQNDENGPLPDPVFYKGVDTAALENTLKAPYPALPSGILTLPNVITHTIRKATAAAVPTPKDASFGKPPPPSPTDPPAGLIPGTETMAASNKDENKHIRWARDHKAATAGIAIGSGVLLLLIIAMIVGAVRRGRKASRRSSMHMRS